MLPSLFYFILLFYYSRLLRIVELEFIVMVMSIANTVIMHKKKERVKIISFIVLIQNFLCPSFDFGVTRDLGIS